MSLHSPSAGCGERDSFGHGDRDRNLVSGDLLERCKAAERQSAIGEAEELSERTASSEPSIDSARAVPLGTARSALSKTAHPHWVNPTLLAPWKMASSRLPQAGIRRREKWNILNVGAQSDRTIGRAKPGQHQSTKDEPVLALCTPPARAMHGSFGCIRTATSHAVAVSFPDAVDTSLNTAHVQRAKPFMLRKSSASASLSSELGGGERGSFMRNASRLLSSMSSTILALSVPRSTTILPPTIGTTLGRRRP